MKKVNYSILILFLAFVFSCNSENKDTNEKENTNDSNVTAALTKEINEPAFENLDIEYDKHKYSANEEKTFKSESGSEISIPKNAFVDADGNPIEGSVDIQYREILSPSEIIFSGVDMKYEKDGEVHDFQTAGMFDIRAFNNGEEVFLQKGKEVTVSFASNIKGDYDFYYYNENEKNWVDTDYGKVEMTNDSENEDIAPTTFKMPKPIKIDPANDLIIEVKANYSNFPNLRKYKGMVWKYAGNKTKEEVKGLLSKVWTDSKLSELDSDNNKYTLTMMNGKKAYDFVVSPVLSGRSYKKALAIYEKEKKKSELVNTSPYTVKRKVSISQMGLHNYDAIYSADRMIVNTDFEIKHNEQLMPSEDINLFHITGENNVVVKYRHRTNTKLYFSPSAKNKIVAIMPGNKVAVMSIDEFNKVSTECSLKGLKSYTLKLNLVDKKITSPADLDEIIASL